MSAQKSQETIIKEKIKEYINSGIISGRRAVATNISYDFDKDRFYVAFYYGDGKRKNRMYLTSKEAIDALTVFEAERIQTQLVMPSNMTVEQYCDYWLEEHCTQTPSTLKFYRNIINVHIKPSSLAKQKIQDVLVSDINGFLSKQSRRSDKKLSSTTIDHHRTCLHTIFQQAENDDVIKSNPVRKSKKIAKKKSFTDAYSLDEIQSIINFSESEPEPYGYIYQLAIYTGLSRGELCGLKWQRIDFRNELLLVVEARTDETHGTETADVKTVNRIRAVDLIDDALALLKKIKKSQDNNRELFSSDYFESDFVLTYSDGNVPYPRTITKNFEWFLNKHNIRKLRFHDLRHTFGTFQRIAGASSYDIKEMMGHSSVTVADQSYIKSYAKALRPQMQKFQDYLHEDKKKQHE